MAMDVQMHERKGAERFINIDVLLTNESASFYEKDLDPTGRKRLLYITGGNYRAVKGIAAVSWKSPDDRLKCIDYQTGRGRWKKVVQYADRLRNGDRPKNGPVYMHPSITSQIDGKLMAIDGTRRLMAYLEAGFDQVEVVVLLGNSGAFSEART